MRDIKFRAWVESKKSMQPAGTLDMWFRIVAETGINPASRSIFMQYTGLKDKNGREIYEGDLLKTDDKEWKVAEVFTCGHFWGVRWKDGQYDVQTGLAWSQGTEVIGNIYENPELLKGGENK